jgi:predicted Zn-dependent protease
MPGAAPGQKPLEVLVAELQTGSSDAQWQAAEALGNLGDLRAVEPLINALSVQHWRVRCSAAQALGRLRDPRAVDALIALVNRRNIDMTSRLAAAEALGNIGDQRAVAPLLNTLRREELDVHATQTLANALQRLGVAPQMVIAERTARARKAQKEEARAKASKQVLWGLGLSVGGIAITSCTYLLAASSSTGGYYVVCTGPIIFGVVLLLIGSIRWLVNRV